MTKLTERQFYNVSTRKVETIPMDRIRIVKFKNGTYSLLALSKNDIKLFKILSVKKIDIMEKKYGKSVKYK